VSCDINIHKYTRNIEVYASNIIQIKTLKKRKNANNYSRKFKKLIHSLERKKIGIDSIH